MDYNNLYSKMINDLKSRSEVSIIKNDFYLKDELAPGFLEKHPYFKNGSNDLHVLNDNHFSWNCQQKNREQRPRGEFHFVSIEDALSPANKKEFSFNSSGQNEQASFYPFDDHPDGGDGIMGCFKITGKDYRIWLHNENGEMFLMELDLAGYLQQTFKLKAIFGWQYLFVNIDLTQPVYSVVRSDLVKRIQILDTLFPEQSYNDLLKKLKKL